MGYAQYQLRDDSKVNSWLLATLYREYLKHYSVELRFAPRDIETGSAKMAAKNISTADPLDGATLIFALHHVTEIHRVPMSPFYLRKFSDLEIASLLQPAPGTVMPRLARGKTIFQNIGSKESHAIGTKPPPNSRCSINALTPDKMRPGGIIHV